MIHHTAGTQHDTVESERKYHKSKGWKDIGYHYFIEVDNKGRGHLKAGRSTELTGAHCDTGNWNKISLGLCVAGNYSKTAMSEELYRDVLGAVLHVMKVYQIPANMLFGHRDKDSTQCPGNLFPLSALKADVLDRLK